MKSTKARKQRKSYFNAPLHKKRKWLASHLEENLLLKYDRRRIPLVTGDTVRVMRGAFKDHEDKVTAVHLKRQQAMVEGVVITKADGKKVAKPIHPSNLMITKLNLTDSWRRRILEKDLSEEAKKEIEQEATVQIKELEEEKRKAEEEEAARQLKEEEKEEVEGEDEDLEAEDKQDMQEDVEDVENGEGVEVKEEEEESGKKEQKKENEEPTDASSEEEKEEEIEKKAQETSASSASSKKQQSTKSNSSEESSSEETTEKEDTS